MAGDGLGLEPLVLMGVEPDLHLGGGHHGVPVSGLVVLTVPSIWSDIFTIACLC